MSVKNSRIMYIERKAELLNGPARIGRVSFSKTGRTLEYRDQKFQKDKSGYKWNHFDVENGDHYWISGPRKTDRIASTRKALNQSKLTMIFAKNTGQRFVALPTPRLASLRALPRHFSKWRQH